MKYKSRLISSILIFTLIFQLLAVKIAAAYPTTNISGKSLNQTLSDKVGFGIYGNIPNGTIPSGMQVPQSQKDGEWRYLGYNFDDNVITNPSYPGDYSTPGGTKVDKKSYTWKNNNFKREDVIYSQTTIALNADSGDRKSAQQIGIDYCELLELATPDKPGAFRVWFDIPPYPGYPNGRLMYITYIIPKNDVINRYSFIYHRIDGTSTSLLPGGALYEKTEYPLRPGITVPITVTAKSFDGYEFTRSIIATSTSGPFGNEKTGAAGMTRGGTSTEGILNYNSSNEFDVIFYYKKIPQKKTLKVKHVYYDVVANKEISTFDSYYVPIAEGGSATEYAQTIPGYRFLKYQHSSDSFYTGTTSTESSFNFDYNDFGTGLEHYVRFMHIKDDSSLTGQILTDKSSYATKSTDTNITIQAKEQTDLTIAEPSFIKEIGARVTSYSVNGGADIDINKSRTGSSIKTISTDYAPITLIVSSLKDGNNTVNIKGYSWWKDDLGKIEEINTTKIVTVTKTATSKPVAIIEAPTSIHAGDIAEVKGSGSDPTGLTITDYEWTTTNGQALTGTGGSVKVDVPVTLTLKVKNSANVWSDTVSHTINTENDPPTVSISVPPTVYLGDDVTVRSFSQDPDGDDLEYLWDTPYDMYGSLEGKSGTVYFMNLGTKDFGLIVTDPSGESASATAQTNVIAPHPSVDIIISGALKENRKVTLDGTNSNGGSKRVILDWSKSKWEITAVSGGTTTDIKTANSYNGTQKMDFLFKKPGIYKAKLTLTNTLGLSSSKEITFEIIEDKAPIADLTKPSTIIRDNTKPTSNGLFEGTFKVTDLSTSEDNDIIAKRTYFVTFDSDNDGDFEEEMCYIYDLDSTLTKQMPYNDSDNLHWRPIGPYKDFMTFDTDNINTGNFTDIEFNSTHVGRYLFDVIVKEEFGQPTIEQFTNTEDRKTGSTY